MDAINRRREHELGQQRVLTVQLPEGYGEEAREYPLLLCLDAQWMFGTVCDSALNLGLARLMPRVIVAGLGWSYADIRDVVLARAYAYTPTVGGFPPEVAAPAGRSLAAGGGPAFLDFLAHEVLALLARHYRIANMPRMLIGHSLSGLFGLFAAAMRPTLFERYLLASPSLWWDGQCMLAAVAGSVGLRGRLYMSMGEEEGVIAGCPMIGSAQATITALRERHPLLDARCEVLPGEIHATTIAGSVTRGLRWLCRDA